MSVLFPRQFYRNPRPTNLYKKGCCGQVSALLAKLIPGTLIYVVKEEAEGTSRYLVIVNDQVGIIQYFPTTSLNSYILVKESTIE